MRKTLSQLNLPAGVITGVLLVISFVGSGFSWWFNERVTVLEGDVPLMPRSKVVRGEKRLAAMADVFNYTCKTGRGSVQIRRFYFSYLKDAGWRVIERKENTVQFERNEVTFRMVLHPQRHKTVFTLHMRYPRSKGT